MRISWRHASAVVTVLAFALSLFTSAISAYTAHLKDIHDRQAQLGDIVEKLLGIPIAETQTLASVPPEAAADMQDNFISQQRMLARQAYTLARSLGSNARTPELMAIATALGNFENYDAAKQIWQQATDSADNFSDEISALRGLGWAKIVWGSEEERRESEGIYDEALSIGAKYRYIARNPEELSYTHALTELAWISAWSEVDCKRAQLHLQRASTYANSAGAVPVADAVRSDIVQWIEALKHCDPYNRIDPRFVPRRTPIGLLAPTGKPENAAPSPPPPPPPSPPRSKQ